MRARNERVRGALDLMHAPINTDGACVWPA